MDPFAFEYAGPEPGAPISNWSGPAGDVTPAGQMTHKIDPVPKAPKPQPAAPVLTTNWLFPVPFTVTRLVESGLTRVDPALLRLNEIPLSNCATLVGLAKEVLSATVIEPALVVNTAVTPLAPLNVNVPAFA